MRSQEPTNLEFFETSKYRIFGRAHLSASPERVFASFAEPSEWPKWSPMLRSATWIGAIGGVAPSARSAWAVAIGVFRERFIAWEPGVRYSFTMFETSSPLVHRFAEDYRLAPENGGTRLDWIMAASPTTIGRIAWPVTKALLSNFFRRSGKKLETLLGYGATVEHGHDISTGEGPCRAAPMTRPRRAKRCECRRATAERGRASALGNRVGDRVDGTDFYVGEQELGHIHLDGEAHVPIGTGSRSS